MIAECCWNLCWGLELHVSLFLFTGFIARGFHFTWSFHSLPLDKWKNICAHKTLKNPSSGDAYCLWVGMKMVIMYLTGISQMCAGRHTNTHTNTQTHTRPTKILKALQLKYPESEHQTLKMHSFWSTYTKTSINKRRVVTDSVHQSTS